MRIWHNKCMRKSACVSLSFSTLVGQVEKSLGKYEHGFVRYWTRNKTSVLWWVKHKYCLTQTRRANHSLSRIENRLLSFHSIVSSLDWSNNDFRLILSLYFAFGQLSLIVCSSSKIINTMRKMWPNTTYNQSLINSDFSVSFVAFSGFGVTRRL